MRVPVALVVLSLLLASGAPAQDENGAGSCVGKGRLRLGWAPGKWEIPPGGGVELDLAAKKILRDCGGKKIIVEGHTDVTGTPEANLVLGEKRAEAVKAALVARGVPAEQLEVQAFGESRPITRDPAPEQQALNRRVTLVAH